LETRDRDSHFLSPQQRFNLIATGGAQICDFVGLFDGDGSCQVNHWRRRSLQYRFIIKLSNITDNQFMLEHIQSFIGGKVRVSSDETEVLWVADNQTVIKRVLHMFDRYPPLTSRVTLQLRFMRHCFHHRNSIQVRPFVCSLGMPHCAHAVKDGKALTLALIYCEKRPP